MRYPMQSTQMTPTWPSAAHAEEATPTRHLQEVEGQAMTAVLAAASPVPASPTSASSWGTDLTTIVDLRIRAKSWGPKDLDRLALESIPSYETRSLNLRLQTDSRPLARWEVHRELDKRNVPPCFRNEHGYEGSERLEFELFLADLHWVATRHPAHRTASSRCRQLFRLESIDSDRWHDQALFVYRYMRGDSIRLAKALGLTAGQRQQCRSMPTSAMRADRRILERGDTLFSQMVDYALDHPDKAGKAKPDHIAERRMQVLKVYLLSGRNKAETVRLLGSLYGRDVNRTTLGKHLEAIELATGLHLAQTRRRGRLPKRSLGCS